jgi:quercetin dioxygenase-like cupin family protein
MKGDRPVTDDAPYFAHNPEAQSSSQGTWVTWSDLEPLPMMGLQFQPVVGEQLMVNFVRFPPDAHAPLHWHEEEQIAFALEGELEFTVAGETRVLRRGDSVVIPPNVPHEARAGAEGCLQVDVFHPPRKGILEAMGR